MSRAEITRINFRRIVKATISTGLGLSVQERSASFPVANREGPRERPAAH